MSLTIELSPDTEAWLAERASAMGQDLPTYVAALLDRTVWSSQTLGERLTPVHQAFADSGMTDDELSDLLESAKHAARAERRAAEAARG